MPMKITKRIERLYSLKEYENIKIIVEATVDVWPEWKIKAREDLSEMVRWEIKKDAEIIKK